ncbi:hypothetical protein M427DRAFT_392830 [Gonapodya prolifera JEL478]|uniref:Uncharacterized protein n=1 Tax=Gonapodya prolifera (strain JEL478) TaxID=1344416 RepID=A0A139A892_GONPJ|nr:hypothetical protein M427DRAFT_392830 [Gonapodya prolifera JEL478]|eukprot:KXS12603.1 hypothetical protein M427DRAFT_392830 [Gonapodya prolifera JEL478]
MPPKHPSLFFRIQRSLHPQFCTLGHYLSTRTIIPRVFVIWASSPFSLPASQPSSQPQASLRRFFHTTGFLSNQYVPSLRKDVEARLSVLDGVLAHPLPTQQFISIPNNSFLIFLVLLLGRIYAASRQSSFLFHFPPCFVEPFKRRSSSPST